MLHRRDNIGEDFKLLGLKFDTSLHMGRAVGILAREAGRRLTALLRGKRFFTQRELVNLYKAQILSYLESGTPGYYHASATVLRSIDRIQERFLREVGLTAVSALERYNLAPLKTRRDISILGILHRVRLGLAPPQISELFPMVESEGGRVPTRLRSRRWAFQFQRRIARTDVYR